MHYVCIIYVHACVLHHTWRQLRGAKLLMQSNRATLNKEKRRECDSAELFAKR